MKGGKHKIENCKLGSESEARGVKVISEETDLKYVSRPHIIG